MRRGPFARDTVRGMLANRFYLGEVPMFVPGSSRRVRAWVKGQHEPLIDVSVFEAARGCIEGRSTATCADRRNASVYGLSGLLRCAQCRERMRVARTEKGRVRHRCRSKAQGLGCSGRGSFLDVYEGQVLADLAGFTLPGEWRRLVLAEATQDRHSPDVSESQRQRPASRLLELREL